MAQTSHSNFNTVSACLEKKSFTVDRITYRDKRFPTIIINKNTKVEKMIYICVHSRGE